MTRHNGLRKTEKILATTTGAKIPQIIGAGRPNTGPL
jgi:hypothetical protein